MDTPLPARPPLAESAFALLGGQRATFPRKGGRLGLSFIYREGLKETPA